MKTLGIGIVGARYGARMHHANFQKLPHGLVEIRGVCSRTMESAEFFARDAEENHSGSNSVFSREWKSTGGGALLRMGSHSVGACLRLKQWEGENRLGRSIRPVSVMADTADLIHTDGAIKANMSAEEGRRVKLE
jgi:hypothetical protein